MKKLFGLFLLALAFLAPYPANAVNCFWVGGTGTWDNAAITHWAPTTGAAATGCATSNAAPTTGDNVTFDASSGGGTVTVDSTINGLSLLNLTAGAFTGTLDFSVNNPSMTFTTGLSFTGTGTRKFLMGTGTFTFTGNATVFNLGTVTNLDGTSNFSTASYVINTNTSFQRTFAGGGRTYGPVSLSATANRGQLLITGSNTFASFAIAAPNYVSFGNSTTHTITTAPTWTGTSSNPILLISNDSSTAATIAISSGTLTCEWCGLNRLTMSGGTARNATNSLDFGGNTGVTITAPSVGGGGGRIIGG